MRRREFIALLGGAAACPSTARAQQPGRMRRVGGLGPFNKDDPEFQPLLAAFKQRLVDLGWTDGRNLALDYRFTGGSTEQIRIAAGELVATGNLRLLQCVAGGIAAGDAHHSDCFRTSIRSSGWRLCRQPAASGWKYHWIPKF
jgi:hypothetical protein